MIAANLTPYVPSFTLTTRKDFAQVAELVDALASGASGRKVVEVRVFSWAPTQQRSWAYVSAFQFFKICALKLIKI